VPVVPANAIARGRCLPHYLFDDAFPRSLLGRLRLDLDAIPDLQLHCLHLRLASYSCSASIDLYIPTRPGCALDISVVKARDLVLRAREHVPLAAEGIVRVWQDRWLRV
jgi:hypothetical protein